MIVHNHRSLPTPPLPHRYVANFSGADTYRAGLDWGYKAGCDFATAKCSATNVGSSYTANNLPWHFTPPSSGQSCSTSSCYTRSPSDGTAVCTTDRRAVATVQQGYVSPMPATTFRYFSDPREGSPAPCMDWCPSPQSQSSLLCSNTGNSASHTAWGETYGLDSMCLRSSVRQRGVVNSPGSGCYQVLCSALNGGAASVVINIPGAGQFTCPPGGPTTMPINTNSYSGSIECPDPVIVCSPGNTYSPGDLILPSQLATPTSSPGALSASATIATYLPYILGGVAGLIVLSTLVSCMCSRCKSAPPSTAQLEAQAQAQAQAQYVEEQKRLYELAQAEARSRPRPQSRLVQPHPQVGGSVVAQGSTVYLPQGNATYASPRGLPPATFYPQPSLTIRTGPIIGQGARV